MNLADILDQLGVPGFDESTTTTAEYLQSAFRDRLAGEMLAFVDKFKAMVNLYGADRVMTILSHPNDDNSFLIAFSDRSAIQVKLSTLTKDELRALAVEAKAKYETGGEKSNV